MSIFILGAVKETLDFVCSKMCNRDDSIYLGYCVWRLLCIVLYTEYVMYTQDSVVVYGGYNGSLHSCKPR